MRVLHVIPSVSPKRGGPSAAVLAMVRALRDHGVDAEIATTTDDGDGVLDVPVAQLIEWEGVPVRFFNRFSPRVRPVREFAYSRSLAAWLAQCSQGYALLHVHALFSYPSTQAMCQARRQRLPYISRPLGQLCQWAIQHRGWKKRAYLALVERANLRGAGAVHFTTEQERSEAEAVEPGLSGFVVPHGLALAGPVPDARARLRAELGLPSDEPVVLFMGRLHPVKGLEVLIPALERLLEQRFTFVLVGDADTPAFEARVQAMLAAAGMAARTRRQPFATGVWKQTLLQGADLFALTSHSENFGVAVVEAMAARLPVVITPGVALADQVARGRAGEVVKSDIPAVAAAILRLLADRALGRRMGESGRLLVEREFAWPSVASRLTDQYQRLMPRGSANTAPETLRTSF